MSARQDSDDTSKLELFGERLRILCSGTSGLRPFVCEGSPLDCEVFIVGANPATEMSRPFWEFWQPGYGFTKSVWLAAYKAARLAKPLKSGRMRRVPIDGARRVIEWLCEDMQPLQCLETNVYSREAPNIPDLTQSDYTTSIFDFLFESIRPTSLLVHGKDACMHLASLLGVALKLWQPCIAFYRDVTMRVLSVPHLSRCWARKDATRAAALLQQLS